jgi:hypothetical protein
MMLIVFSLFKLSMATLSQLLNRLTTAQGKQGEEQSFKDSRPLLMPGISSADVEKLLTGVSLQSFVLSMLHRVQAFGLQSSKD